DEVGSMAFAPSDPACNTYAFGTAFGKLLRTLDGGQSWTDMDPGNGVPDRWVTYLAFDPGNANILYAALSGFDEGTPGHPGHLFKTTNALADLPTWFDISPPVNLPCDSVVVDPWLRNSLYVGTDLGVWKPTDAGATRSH